MAAAQGKVAKLDEQINGLRSKIANTKQASAEIDAECDTLQDKKSGLYESVQVRTAKRDQRYSKLAKEALQLLSEKTGQQIDTSDYTLNDILSVTHSKGLPKTSGGTPKWIGEFAFRDGVARSVRKLTNEANQQISALNAANNALYAEADQLARERDAYESELIEAQKQIKDYKQNLAKTREAALTWKEYAEEKRKVLNCQ